MVALASASACARAPRRRETPPLCDPPPEDRRLLLALGFQDLGLTVALRLQDRGPLVALRLHLAGHRVDQIGRRRDVLDLDARHLDAPRRGRLVDHVQQLRVDPVPLREQLVQVHRAHHGTHVGHDQIDDRALQIGDLIGGLDGVQELEEHDAIDRDHGVVLGDDLLRGHVQDLLHHVQPGADPLDEGCDDVQPGPQGAHVAAEPLDRVFHALRRRLDARRDEHHSDAGRTSTASMKPSTPNMTRSAKACDHGLIAGSRLTISERGDGQPCPEPLSCALSCDLL